MSLSLETIIMGMIPAAMAAAIEFFNPVNERQIRRNAIEEIAAQIGETPEISEEIAEAIARTAIGAVEIYALVLTWISLTCGLAAVLVEIINLNIFLIGASVWIFFSGLFGIKYFQGVDYYGMGNISAGLWRNSTKSEAYSKGIMWINVVIFLGLLILAVFIAEQGSKAEPSSPDAKLKAGAEITSHH